MVDGAIVEDDATIGEADVVPAIPALVAVGDAIPGAVTPVATTGAAVEPAATVTPAVIAPPSAPLTIAGTGSELMDRFTVTCGFASAEGGWNWPGATTT